ncbi:MAG TPA: ABC transporter permease [Deltaproteobacteria bacterium]|nr:ABC transporter permease [Deltaproteobacteria bacterium]HQJ07439.1 ABC transporter permease [Deltaproteobacteria bacterium]
MSLRKIVAVTRKEFYHLMRDPRSLILAFVMPLCLILMFGYALSLDVNNVEVVFVDYDRTDLSRDLIRRIDASPYFHVGASLRNAREVAGYLDRGWTEIGIVIPPDFTRNIRSERPAPLQVLMDGSDPNFASISRGYINAFIERYNRMLLLEFLDKKGVERIKPPVEGRIRVWFNEDLESRKFIVPGLIAVIIMIAGAMLTSLVIAREYENGTMETIKSLPITAFELLMGKSIPYFIIALSNVLISVLLAQVLFGIVMKASFWLMMAASAIYIFVALALGLLISTATKSQLLANQGAILLTFLPSQMLSDFIFPVSNMPKALQLVTYAVPAKYYINILGGIFLKDLPFMSMWKDFAVLALMFLLMAFISMRLLKKEGL